MKKKMLTSLIEILEKEHTNYNQLNKLALQKKKAIIDNDIQRLTKLLENDNQIIDKLEKLENDRAVIVSQLADLLSLNNKDVSFQELITAISDPWQIKLSKLKERLLQILNKLHEQNDQNRILVEEALKLNKFSIDLLMKVLEPANITYNQPEGRKHVTHLIDRKG